MIRATLHCHTSIMNRFFRSTHTTDVRRTMPENVMPAGRFQGVREQIIGNPRTNSSHFASANHTIQKMPSSSGHHSQKTNFESL